MNGDAQPTHDDATPKAVPVGPPDVRVRDGVVLPTTGGAARPVARLRWKVPLLLFLATCVSTFLVGGPVYCAALMTILGCHELGHFVQARRYGVPASLPFFLPMPLPPIGTMGAVIAMDARVKDRKALFDIGISGPLAGLVPTLACCVLGLQYPYSKIGPAIDTLPIAQRFGHQLGEPLLFTFLGRLTFGPLPEGHDIFIGPLAMAGWVGLLITAINLFPIGQLDGGHVLYALLRDRAHAVATTMLAAAIAGVVFAVWWLEQKSMAGWTVMLLLLTLMGPRHPPTAKDDVPLGAGRVVLGWATLAFLIVGFTPNPFPGL